MLPVLQGESERRFAEIAVNLTCAVLIHKFGEDRARIEAQCFGKIDKLDDINPALTDFDAGDDGLRGLHSGREFVLRHPGSLSSGFQRSAQGAMSASSKSFQSACSQLQARTYNAKIDLCDF
jgi:hypothetical protein